MGFTVIGNGFSRGMASNIVVGLINGDIVLFIQQVCTG